MAGSSSASSIAEPRLSVISNWCDVLLYRWSTGLSWPPEMK